MVCFETSRRLLFLHVNRLDSARARDKRCSSLKSACRGTDGRLEANVRSHTCDWQSNHHIRWNNCFDCWNKWKIVPDKNLFQQQIQLDHACRPVCWVGFRSKTDNPRGVGCLQHVHSRSRAWPEQHPPWRGVVATTTYELWTVAWCHDRSRGWAGWAPIHPKIRLKEFHSHFFHIWSYLLLAEKIATNIFLFIVIDNWIEKQNEKLHLYKIRLSYSLKYLNIEIYS